MAKRSFNYFEAFQRHAACGADAAKFLNDILSDYDFDNLSMMLQDAHKIENRADDINHEILSHLRADFVTPLEREDISQLASLIDDISNEIEDIVMAFYMYHVKEIDPYMVEMSKEMMAGIDSLCKALENLPRFKKASEEMLPLLVAVNDAEEACDRLYLKAMHELHDPDSGFSYLKVRAYSRVYGAFEDALDSIEDTAEFVEEIIMTNL